MSNQSTHKHLGYSIVVEPVNAISFRAKTLDKKTTAVIQESFTLGSPASSLRFAKARIEEM